MTTLADVFQNSLAYNFFDENVVRSDHLVIFSYMLPLLIIYGHYDVMTSFKINLVTQSEFHDLLTS